MGRVSVPTGCRKRPNGGWEWRFTHKGIRVSVGGDSIEKVKEKAKEKYRRLTPVCILPTGISLWGVFR